MDIYPLDGAPQFLQTNISAAGWRGDVVAGQGHLTPDTMLAKTVAGVKVTPENADALGVDLKALDTGPVGDLKVELQPDQLISGRKFTLKCLLTDATTGQPARDLIPCQCDGTERPFDNAYCNNKEPGIFVGVVSSVKFS